MTKPRPISEADPKRILGNNLRRIRHEAGISQEELADRANLHRTYVSSIERGERNVSVENIFAIARALSVPPSVLLEVYHHQEVLINGPQD
ncbi:MAG TPA: helix-turn-helix transcriptional regulator [Pyrinomonadaceae bacterium]